MKKTILLLLALFVICTCLPSCDVDEGMSFLEQANEDEIVAFLTEKEDSIRQEYEAWKGNVIEYNETHEIPVCIGDNLETKAIIEIKAHFITESASKICYFVEELILRLKNIEAINISCGGYVTPNNNCFYDYYKIRGVLLSSQYNYFHVDSFFNTEKWVDFFSPDSFLMNLYNYSFDELDQMGEKFYFARNNVNDYSCKVEHSLKYSYIEDLIDMSKAKEIFPDHLFDILGFYESEQIERLINDDEAFNDYSEEIDLIDYYTIYSFNSDSLTKADVFYQAVLEGDWKINRQITTYPFDGNLSINESKYEEKDFDIDLRDYYQGVDIEELLSEVYF